MPSENELINNILELISLLTKSINRKEIHSDHKIVSDFEYIIKLIMQSENIVFSAALIRSLMELAFPIIDFLSEKKLLESMVKNLLDLLKITAKYPQLIDWQILLLDKLGDVYLSYKSYKDAMHCYVTGSRLVNLAKISLEGINFDEKIETTNVFFAYDYFTEKLELKVHHAIQRDVDKKLKKKQEISGELEFPQLINHAEQLINFLLKQREFNKAHNLCEIIHKAAEKHANIEKLSSLIIMIRQAQNNTEYSTSLLPLLPDFKTKLNEDREKSKKDCQAFLCKEFAPENENKIVEFQALQMKITEDYINLIVLMIKQAEIFLGKPPCKYHVRIMGSGGRGDMVFYSDVELFVLIENKEFLTYFIKFFEFIELQTISLGETPLPAEFPLFKSLGNHHRCGFRLDMEGENIIAMPIGTPEQLAARQVADFKEDTLDSSSMNKSATSLRVSRFVYGNDGGLLYADYREKMDDILKPVLKKNAIKVFIKEYYNYIEICKEPTEQYYQIKKRYIAPLTYILVNFSFYYDLIQRHIIEIINKLTEQGNLQVDFARTIKKAWVEVQLIRMRLHLENKEQCETAFEAHADKHLTLTQKEKENLDFFEVAVLFPLFQFIESTFVKSIQPYEQEANGDLKFLPWSDKNLIVRMEKLILHEKNTLQNLDPPLDEFKKQLGDYNVTSGSYLFHKLLKSMIVNLADRNASPEHYRKYYKMLPQMHTSFALKWINETRKTYNSWRMEYIFKSLENYPFKDGVRPSLNKEKQIWEQSLQKLFVEEEDSVFTIGDRTYQIKVNSCTLGKKFLTPQVTRKLYDPKEHTNEGVLAGTHSVYGIELDALKVHLKFYPEQPLMEYGICVFHKLFIGQGTPQIEIMKFEVITTKNGQRENFTVPVLCSQTIEGFSLYKHSGKLLSENLNESKPYIKFGELKLDHKSFSQLVLVAMLINPEDGKPDNFVVVPIKDIYGKVWHILISIDNDRAFFEPLSKEGFLEGYRLKLNVKTLLYCFDLMKEPLHPEAVEEFLTLEPYKVLRQWLTEVNAYANKVKSIFTEEEIIKLQNREPHKVYIPLLIKAGQMGELYQKIYWIRNILKEKPKISHIELLRHIYPLLSKYFQDVLKLPLSPEQRFFKLTEKEYKIVNKGTVLTAVSTSINQHFQTLLVAMSTKRADGMNKKQYGLEQCIDELKVIRLQEGTLAYVAKELQEGKTENYKNLLLDDFREQIINKYIDFSALLTPEGEIDLKLQKLIIQAMLDSKTSFRTLKIKGCHVLDETAIKTLVAQSPNLMLLSLIDCVLLGDKIITILGECQALDELTLGGLREIKNILVSDTVFRFGEKPFARLRRLNLVGNKNLEKIYLDMPLLEELAIEHSDKLSTLGFAADALTKLAIIHCKNLSVVNAPEVGSLRQLTLRDCPTLSEKAFVPLFSLPKELERLQIDSCDNVPKAYLLQMIRKNNLWNSYNASNFVANDLVDLSELELTDKDIENLIVHLKNVKFSRFKIANISLDNLLKLLHYFPALEIIEKINYQIEPNKLELSHLSKVQPMNPEFIAQVILPDNEIALARKNGIEIWKVSPEVKHQRTLLGHENDVLALAFFADKQYLISGTKNGVIGICPFDISKLTKKMLTFKVHAGAIKTLLALPDNQIASGTLDDNVIKIGKIVNTEYIAVHELKGHTKGILFLALSQKNHLISSSLDKTIKVWDITTGACLLTLKGHKEPAWALIMLNNDWLASGAQDGEIKLWDFEQGTCLATFTEHHSKIESLAKLASHLLISASHDGSIKMWDIFRKVCVRTIPAHNGWIRSILSTKTGNLISYAYDNTFALWEFPQVFLHLNSRNSLACYAEMKKNESSIVVLLRDFPPEITTDEFMQLCTDLVSQYVDKHDYRVEINAEKNQLSFNNLKPGHLMLIAALLSGLNIKNLTSAENLSPRSEPSQELTSTAEDKEEIVSNESVFKI